MGLLDDVKFIMDVNMSFGVGGDRITGNFSSWCAYG